MAFTTIAGLSTARRHVLQFQKNNIPSTIGVTGTAWASGSSPAIGGLAGNTTTGVVPTSATTGALALQDPASGDTAVAVAARVTSLTPNGIEGVFLLADRLWHAGAFTPFAGAYAGLVGTPLTRSTDAVCVELWVEITTVLSAAAHTLTITYTNQAGATGRTGTVTLPASAAAGRAYMVTLQAGDTGVSQVTGMSGSATPPTGAFALVLAKIHASFPSNGRGTMQGLPSTFLKMMGIPIPAGACLFFLAISGGNVTVGGSLEIAYG